MSATPAPLPTIYRDQFGHYYTKRDGRIIPMNADEARARIKAAEAELWSEVRS